MLDVFKVSTLTVESVFPVRLDVASALVPYNALNVCWENISTSKSVPLLVPLAIMEQAMEYVNPAPLDASPVRMVTPVKLVAPNICTMMLHVFKAVNLVGTSTSTGAVFVWPDVPSVSTE